MSDKYLGENLIFIISQPRSGSTLLQRVLAGNDAVVASSEPWLMLHPVYGVRSTGIHTEYGADWAAQGVNEFLENYTDGPEVYDDGIRAFAKTIYENAMHKGGGTWFIDKTPRYLMILEDLLRLFPAAKFVFLIRNPLSVLASILNTQISHDLYTLERFREELLLGPSAIINAISKLGDEAIVVRYEEFVIAPEEHTRTVCEAIGIEYQSGMVDYADSEPVKGFMQDRTGIQQHDRPSASRIESWRQMLVDPQQIHFAQNYLCDLGVDTIDRLGYSYDELNDAVRHAAERKRGGLLLPWRVALLHPKELKGRDQQAITLYRNIRDHGPVIGHLKTIGAFWIGLWRQVQFVFGWGRS
jgi:hypothetical protein